MKKITADEIDNGMILAKDVVGSSGNTLLGKGSTLSAAMGRRLKNWGITVVYIEGNEEEEENVVAETKSPDDIRNELTRRFEGVLDNPIMKEIFSAVLTHRQAQ